jgi:hypothetical protein
MATIPLDGWWPHRDAVSLFRRRRDRLSLVCHGNDHVRNELLAPSDPAAATSIAAQAMIRIKVFEARYGVQIDRVMTPPHGMCSPEMARALGAVGFDALCSIHPMPWTETPSPDRILAGWEPAEFAGPCAVLPRFPLHSSATDVAIRAFLDHPLILYGHHEDLAGGLDLLAEAAQRVNRLGEVEWMTLGDMGLGHGLVRIDGPTAWVRPLSGRLRIWPAGATERLVVLPPRDAADEFSGWTLDGASTVPFGQPIPWQGKRLVEVRLQPAAVADPHAVPAPAWTPWPVVRRAATELRDRALPLRRVGADLC